MEDYIPGFNYEDEDDEISGFYDDDGNKLNPNLLKTPSLCLVCRLNGNPHEEILCILTRFDQQEDEEFICHSFQPMNEDFSCDEGELLN